jgi:hypothetical protein
MDPMDIVEVRRLCEQLREVIGAGPGKNDLALNEAVTVVRLLQQAAPWNGPNDKLVTVKGWLTIWFSQRNWRKYGVEGEICRQSLLDDILVVENYWERKPAQR